MHAFLRSCVCVYHVHACGPQPQNAWNITTITPCLEWGICGRTFLYTHMYSTAAVSDRCMFLTMTACDFCAVTWRGSEVSQWKRYALAVMVRRDPCVWSAWRSGGSVRTARTHCKANLVMRVSRNRCQTVAVCREPRQRCVELMSVSHGGAPSYTSQRGVTCSRSCACYACMSEALLRQAVDVHCWCVTHVWFCFAGVHWDIAS